MSSMVANLSEIAALYGLKASPVTVDHHLCLTTKDGLAAVHHYAGSSEDVIWTGQCLQELTKRGVKGINAIMKTVNDGLLAEINKGKFFLTEYTPGVACDSSNIFEVRTIGRLIGQVHAASEDVLYFSAPPATRVAPAWREAARERVAYWGLAAHRYRQGERGEAVRQLLRHAEESLSRMEELSLRCDEGRLLTFANLSFSKFVYGTVGHQVYLNDAHSCLTDWAYTSVGNMIIESSYTSDMGLHFLSAYTAVHPFTAVEWQMLFAYLLYPHEWAETLDELTRGRPAIKGREVLMELGSKDEWIDWLQEQSLSLQRGDRRSPTPTAEISPMPIAVVQQEPISAPSIELVKTAPEKIVWKSFPRKPDDKGKSPRSRR